MRRSLLLSLIFLMLVGCKDNDPIPLPEGEITLEGFLTKAELSLVRRGTHLLSEGDEPLYYAESRSVNLRDYEGKRVQATGMVEYNTDPMDLPVLVVSAIQTAGSGSTVFNATELALSFEVPGGWSASEEPGRILLSDESTGSIALVVESEVYPSGGDYETFIAGKAHGEPIVVSHHQARRIYNEQTGHQVIYVDRGSRALVLLFTPSHPQRIVEESAMFVSLLRSLKLQSPSGVRPTVPSSQTSSTATQPLQGTGMPCGGVAGILCPTGLFCKITNTTEGIGVCTQLSGVR